MEQKKPDNREDVKELSDEEVETATGGMKFILHDQPNFLRTILRLLFRIKD